MEYFWIVLAALGSGIGIGLAGISTATLMVPMMIVLCPSFARDTGAYQATAIALAADVLGSAAAASVYIKNKNIDLRRGGLMTVCILITCIAGSIAAFLVEGVVLGGFSLFLCVAIGIRFLVKPDSQRRETVDKGEKLGIKGVIISVFFGLTIGFGIGFVGSGGGMMMLIVYTAFLGMGLKHAVGTSTFTMAFATLIASVTHILFEPAILLERWDVLLICIVVSTLGSVISARFANKVKNKTVGIVTGITLTVIGAAMIILNYWDTISGYVIQLLRSEGILCGLLAVQAVVIVALRIIFRKMPKELSRKILQIPALSVVLILVYVSDNWIAASAAAVLLALILYPVLTFVEHTKTYAGLMQERRGGEVKKSLLLLFFTDAALIAVCWGLLDKPYIAVTAVMVWGISDSAAALFGKKYGKHHIMIPFADHKKTWEGSLALAVTALITGFVTLMVVSDMAWYSCLITAAAVTPFAAVSEMLSHNGNDTVTCPAAIAVVLYLAGMVV